MSKELKVHLPLLQLNPRLLFLPGIVYRTSFTREQAHAILARFGAVLNETGFEFKGVVQEAIHNPPQHVVSKEALDGCVSVKAAFDSKNDDKWLVLACLPGVTSSTTAATVCVISDISEKQKEIVIGFRALARGQLQASSKDPQNESTVVVQVKDETKLSDEAIRKTLDRSRRLFDNVSRFVKQYRSAASVPNDLSEEKKLENVMLVLTPLASVLYEQLSSPEVAESFGRLDRMFQSFEKDWQKLQAHDRSARLLQLVDILVAVFPFALSHKLQVLSEKPANVVVAAQGALDFGNKLFEESLNMDYLVETWRSLDVRNSPRRASLTRSRFISNHLKSLKLLLDDISGDRSRPSRTLSRADAEDDDDSDEVTQFVKNLEKYDIAADGKKMVLKDFKRMSAMQPSNSEYQLLRTYLEIVADIPWTTERKPLKVDLDAAKTQLDNDHYGLFSVKERILEYLAVLSLHEKLTPPAKPVVDQISLGEPAKQPKKAPVANKSVAKPPILLLTGPPGVGKTSLAKSIASSLGRKFQRISLGGLRDESEIKGHRRTYIGALPGMLVQALRKAQVMNPVILLDEIDKVIGGSGEAAARAHGDPAAALLEVLDPEQNVNFHDHYIGFPIDLSQVVFICTSNDLYRLSEPLRDRMEVIELSGYSYMEKVEICKRYLIPKQLERNGIPLQTEDGESYLQISDEAILKIAVDYTREAGIRSLERMVGSICRGKAIELSKLIRNSENLKKFPSGYNPAVTELDLARYIGISPHSSKVDKAESGITPNYGVVNGLSYNSDGSGGLLVFEMNGVEGSQSLTTTGRLGTVLVESIKIANTIVKSVLNDHLLEGKDIDTEKLLKRYNALDAHLHVPQGAVSKDGPSAGITITLCLLSLVLQREVPSNIAMTGEIDLRGLVLPIGGVREKLLGAHLSKKVDKVLLPRANRKDVTESYIYSIAGDAHSEEVLARLIRDEEISVNSPDKHARLDVIGEQEKWVKESLGLEIVYVEEFADVVGAVWNRDVSIQNSEYIKPVCRL